MFERSEKHLAGDLPAFSNKGKKFWQEKEPAFCFTRLNIIIKLILCYAYFLFVCKVMRKGHMTLENK